MGQVVGHTAMKRKLRAASRATVHTRSVRWCRRFWQATRWRERCQRTRSGWRWYRCCRGPAPMFGCRELQTVECAPRHDAHSGGLGCLRKDVWAIWCLGYHLRQWSGSATPDLGAVSDALQEHPWPRPRGTQTGPGSAPTRPTRSSSRSSPRVSQTRNPTVLCHNDPSSRG